MGAPSLLATAGALVIAGTALPARSAQAGLALNVGLAEVLAVPEGHVGVYLFAGLSHDFDLGGWYLSPWLGVEASPELGRWGFSLSLTADFPVSDTVGVDVILTTEHDQEGARWSEAELYEGLGAGVSITVGDVVISPSLDVYLGLNVPGWSLAPTLNVGFPL